MIAAKNLGTIVEKFLAGKIPKVSSET